MRANIFLIMGTLMFAVCATVSPESAMQADVEQAAAIIERFEAIPEAGIPPAVMRAARGLAILSVSKAGFIGSVRGGTGVVVQRTDSGWSGPSAIGTGGIGAGLQAGVEISELVIVLNTPAAVEAFAKGEISPSEARSAWRPVRSVAPSRLMLAGRRRYTPIAAHRGFSPVFRSRVPC